MLDLFAGDDAAGGGGGGFEWGDGVASDGDGQLCIAEFHLHINGVGLLGYQAHILQDPLLEALGADGDVEVVGRQGIEVVDAAGIRGGGDDVIGVGIGQGEGGSGDDSSLRIGHDTLD